MRVFPLWFIIIFLLVGGFFLSWDEFFSDNLRQLGEEDKKVISELESLQDSNLIMIEICFSTEKKERYDVIHRLMSYFDPPHVFLKSRRRSIKDFKKVSKQLFKIFIQAGIDVSEGKINDGDFDISQIIFLPIKTTSQQLIKAIKEYPMYFYDIEVKNWKIIPKAPGL